MSAERNVIETMDYSPWVLTNHRPTVSKSGGCQADLVRGTAPRCLGDRPASQSGSDEWRHLGRLCALSSTDTVGGQRTGEGRGGRGEEGGEGDKSHAVTYKLACTYNVLGWSVK